MNRERWKLYAFLGLGLAFLYLPVLLLIVYSFNASREVTVWTGLSTRWYLELLDNRQLLDAAWLSVRIAATNATFASSSAPWRPTPWCAMGGFADGPVFSSC